MQQNVVLKPRPCFQIFQRCSEQRPAPTLHPGSYFLSLLCFGSDWWACKQNEPFAYIVLVGTSILGWNSGLRPRKTQLARVLGIEIALVIFISKSWGLSFRR